MPFTSTPSPIGISMYLLPSITLVVIVYVNSGSTVIFTCGVTIWNLLLSIRFIGLSTDCSPNSLRHASLNVPIFSSGTPLLFSISSTSSTYISGTSGSLLSLWISSLSLICPCTAFTTSRLQSFPRDSHSTSLKACCCAPADIGTFSVLKMPAMNSSCMSASPRL